MAVKKDSKKSTTSKSKDTKKSSGKKGSGIIDKVKNAAGEILTRAAAGAAAGALNIAADAVGSLLEGGGKKGGGKAGTRKASARAATWRKRHEQWKNRRLKRR